MDSNTNVQNVTLLSAAPRILQSPTGDKSGISSQYPSNGLLISSIRISRTTGVSHLRSSNERHTAGLRSRDSSAGPCKPRYHLLMRNFRPLAVVEVVSFPFREGIPFPQSHKLAGEYPETCSTAYCEDHTADSRDGCSRIIFFYLLMLVEMHLHSVPHRVLHIWRDS